MSTLLTAIDLAKSFADHHLFEAVTLNINAGDRIGLIGPNGSGKSTLLKILAGLIEPGEGEITTRRNLNLAYVGQHDLFEPADTPLSATTRYAHQHHTHAHDLDPDTRASIALSQLGFSAPPSPSASSSEQLIQAPASPSLSTPVTRLSGGWRKRLSIACALATDPDVMMLDEPTNHLDLEGVVWLENFVRTADCAMVLITHDRTFLDRTASRIIELSRAYPNGTFQVDGNYSQFLRRKNEFLDAQRAQQAALASVVRRDNAWLEQGIQGRQTRNKSQVIAASHRREELRELRKRNNVPLRATQLGFVASDRKTVKLINAENLSKTLGNKPLFRNVDLTLSPGMKLGLLGPNGSGKSTFLKTLAKQIDPDTGTVKYANDLRLSFFSQHRDTLDPKLTLKHTLCPNGHTVYLGDRQMHVTAWAAKFLFEPRQLMTPVGSLSGGEQARVHLASLMLRPADVLFLDEPTNDLDIPSLEVLEQSLTEFPGAIVLVTHDRFMLQRVCNDYLALDGLGNASRHASYKQWEAAPPTSSPTQPTPLSPATPQSPTTTPQTTHSVTSAPTTATQPTQRKKLTYKLQRELDMMEDTILAAESEAESLEAKAADPAVIADHAQHAAICAKLGELHTRIQQLYDRWQQLEAMQES